MKHITRTWLCLTPFRQLKSTHSLQDSISFLYSYKHDIESVMFFFPHCSLYSNERRTLLSIDNTDSSPETTIVC